MPHMNIRITKLYQGAPHGSLEVAFNASPEGDKMMDEIRDQGISAAELEAWRERLQAHAIAIEGEMSWPRGGKSLYFRDPDGHLVELATPGLWSVY